LLGGGGGGDVKNALKGDVANKAWGTGDEQLLFQREGLADLGLVL